MKRIPPSITLVAILALISGCVAPQPEPQETLTTKVQYQMPVLTPVDAGKQNQEQDGIRITVTPGSYTTRETVQREYRRELAILVVKDQWPVKVRETPNAAVFPKDIRFKVKINNRHDHVLRLAGTVVAYQVGGKAITVDKVKYQEFANSMILPRQEAEFEIGGPELAAIEDNDTVALFLYDMVTTTDAAGNPTKRSNFEFLYQLTRRSESKEVSVNIKDGAVSQVNYNLMMRRDQGHAGTWLTIPEFD